MQELSGQSIWYIYIYLFTQECPSSLRRVDAPAGRYIPAKTQHQSEQIQWAWPNRFPQSFESPKNCKVEAWSWMDRLKPCSNHLQISMNFLTSQGWNAKMSATSGIGISSVASGSCTVLAKWSLKIHHGGESAVGQLSIGKWFWELVLSSSV